MAIATSALPTRQGSQALKNIGDPYIRLQLSDDAIAAVDTRQAQEVLVIAPQQLAVVPNMPTTVMGLINHRSRIFWVIDLPQIFGLTPLDPRAAEYHLAVLHVGNVHVGIAVQHVLGVTRVAQEAIASPLDNHLSEALVPYLRGCVLSDPMAAAQEASALPQKSLQQDMLLILDGAAIAAYKP